MSTKKPILNNTLQIKFLLRAFGYRNYRLFFAGQGISLIGTWMQTIAVSWLAYRLTGSVFLLGLIGFAAQIPTFILAPFAGVLADHWNRWRILITTQSLAMLQAFILAFLAIGGIVTVRHIITLSIFLGLVSAFDIPARQAFLSDVVERREDFGNAIALNSSLFNIARLIGPSIAGVLIAIVGEGICFLLNGISFLAVIFALLAMRIKPEKIQSAKNSHILQGLKEGIVYTFGFAPIRYILLLLTLVSLVGMSYVVTVPVFARDILAGGPRVLGFLMASAGLGAILGAIYLASRKSPRGLESVIFSGTIIFGIALIAFSFSRVLWISLLSMFFGGFGMMIQMASSNTILQHITDDDKRGRVMSFFTMAFMGMAPFGSLLAGGLASRIGAPNTVLISGTSCILGALFFADKLLSIAKVKLQ